LTHYTTFHLIGIGDSCTTSYKGANVVCSVNDVCVCEVAFEQLQNTCISTNGVLPDIFTFFFLRFVLIFLVKVDLTSYNVIMC